MFSDTAAPQRSSGTTRSTRAAAFGILICRAIGFSGGVDSSFLPRSVPASCLPTPSTIHHAAHRPAIIAHDAGLRRPVGKHIRLTPRTAIHHTSCGGDIGDGKDMAAGRQPPGAAAPRILDQHVSLGAATRAPQRAGSPSRSISGLAVHDNPRHVTVSNLSKRPTILRLRSAVTRRDDVARPT